MESITPALWESVAGKVLACLIIILVAFGLYRLAMMPVKRLLVANEHSKRGGTIFQNILRVAAWCWAVCSILDIVFGIDMAGVLAAMGVVGIAVSLGAQQTIANVIGGIIVSLSTMVGPGDWITLPGHAEARFIDTNWRRTTLENEDGVLYAVPNSEMVSNVLEKGNPYYFFVVPFSLKPNTPDVKGLLADCEQVVLDAQKQQGMDYEGMRPKAHINGAALGAIQAEIKVYANREFDTRVAKRAVLPALIDLLQGRDALAQLEMTPAQAQPKAQE